MTHASPDLFRFSQPPHAFDRSPGLYITPNTPPDPQSQWSDAATTEQRISYATRAVGDILVAADEAINNGTPTIDPTWIAPLLRSGTYIEQGIGLTPRERKFAAIAREIGHAIGTQDGQTSPQLDPRDTASLATGLTVWGDPAARYEVPLWLQSRMSMRETTRPNNGWGDVSHLRFVFDQAGGVTFAATTEDHVSLLPAASDFQALLQRPHEIIKPGGFLTTSPALLDFLRPHNTGGYAAVQPGLQIPSLHAEESVRENTTGYIAPTVDLSEVQAYMRHAAGGDLSLQQSVTTPGEVHMILSDPHSPLGLKAEMTMAYLPRGGEMPEAPSLVHDNGRFTASHNGIPAADLEWAALNVRAVWEGRLLDQGADPIPQRLAPTAARLTEVVYGIGRILGGGTPEELLQRGKNLS